MRLTSSSICAAALLLTCACVPKDDPATSAEGSESSSASTTDTTETSAGTTDTGGDDELPEDWEDAVAIELSQAPATGGCEPGADMSLEVGVIEGRIQAVIDGLTISCAEAYEGFVRPREGGGFDLLVQPINMHPEGLAGCVCRNRLRGVLPDAALGDAIDIYQRPSFEEDPDGTLNSLGSETVEDIAAGCDQLVPCDDMNPCANEGNEDPEEYFDYCVELAGCGGPVCIGHEEACMVDCGVLDCAILESNPEGVSCE